MAKTATIGLIGAGAMGSGIGGLLTGNGMRVLTPLEGRSDASKARAAQAGMVDASYDDLAAADLVMSILPPAQARQVAERFADTCAAKPMPVYVDGNALSPETKRELQQVITAAGGLFVDGVIIGGPPHEAYDGPRLYVSGQHASAAGMLRQGGLDVRELAGPVGAAAALKMCYGGFNKGITALTTAVLLAARRSGADKALIDEFAISQQALLARSKSSIPRMYPKAYRWVAEFDEIAAFNGDDPASGQIFAAIARFYEGRAEAFENGDELERLIALLGSEGA